VTVINEWFMMNEEVQLLQEFARTGSQEVFSRLVEANVGLVYSAAMRQLRDHHLAEDVAQQAFIKLAQKATTLQRETVAAAWLLVTTRYLACDAKRAAARRAAREQKAAQMRSNTSQSPDHDPWSDIEPLLDDALCSLSSDDRRAVTLRYLQGRNVEQVAAALDVTRDAAAQRLHRAIGRLRDFLLRRGAVVDRAALGSLMLSRGFQTPPPALAASIVKSAAAAHAGIGIVSKGATMAVVSTKAKIVTTATVLALTLGGTATVVYKATQPKSRVVTLDSATPSPGPIRLPTVSEVGWRPNFDRVYSMAPGEILKRVPSPYIPERNSYFAEAFRGQPMISEVTSPSSAAIYTFDQQAEWNSAVPEPFTFLGLAQSLTGLRKYDFEGLGSLGSLRMPGDWVRRRGTSVPQFMQGFEQILASQFGRQVRFVPRTVERDVLVASGTVQIHAPPQEMGNNMVAIYVGKRSGDGYSYRAGQLGEMIAEIGELFGLKGINQITPKDKQGVWHYYIKPGTILTTTAREELLKNLSDQTGMTFKFERRPVEIWFVEPSPGMASPTSAAK
jgi:RNA polymerase sigma factor (sigma-70 family)